MMSKKSLLGILIVLALVFGGFYYNNSKSLKGSFSEAEDLAVQKKLETGVAAVKGKLMSVESAGSGSLTLTKGSTMKYVLGKWKVNYKNDSQPCNVSFGISRNGSIKQLYSSSSQDEKFLERTQLAVLIDEEVSTFAPNDAALSEFSPDFSAESGKSYIFYLYGYVPSDASSMNNAEVYITSLCAMPESGGYSVWDSEDSSGQNSSFSVENDSTGFGIPGGTEINIQ